jgi:hypothetical protein
MKKENDIQAELRELDSPLANMSRVMPYVIPGGYFEWNLSNIFLYTEALDVTITSKELPFAVPPGFFETLPQKIFALAQAEDVVASMPKSMPYTVPQGYFDTLCGNISGKLNAKPVGRAINFAPRQWMRQGVAAVILLAVGLGGYEYVAHRHITPEKQLAKVSENTVREYVHQNLNDADAEQFAPTTNLAVVNAIKQLDQSDVEQYLDETGLKTEYSIN